MQILRFIAFLILFLNLILCVVVVGTVFYSTMDAFAPTSSFMSFDFRIMTTVFAVLATSAIALVGLVYSGIGTVVSLLLREELQLVVVWVVPGLLYATELLAVALMLVLVQ